MMSRQSPAPSILQKPPVEAEVVVAGLGGAEAGGDVDPSGVSEALPEAGVVHQSIDGCG